MYSLRLVKVQWVLAGRTRLNDLGFYNRGGQLLSTNLNEAKWKLYVYYTILFLGTLNRTFTRRP